MRLFTSRRAGAIMTITATSTMALVAAGASAATVMAGTVKLDLGSSFPDPATWALMLVSFALIGSGVRSRKRSVVLA